MCVQDADDRCVLQFTLHNAAGCALHRRASRVIHRSELCIAWSGPRCVFASTRSARQAEPRRTRALARSLLQSCLHEPTCGWGGPRSLDARPSALGSLSDNRPPCDGGVRLYRRPARRPTHPRRSVNGPPPFAALQPRPSIPSQFNSCRRRGAARAPPLHRRSLQSGSALHRTLRGSKT